MIHINIEKDSHDEMSNSRDFKMVSKELVMVSVLDSSCDILPDHFD